jgi:hypothetical protein
MVSIDVDVSGEDLLSQGYVICAVEEKKVKAFKMDARTVSAIHDRLAKGSYKYKRSKRGKSSLKIRIYCVVVIALIKSLRPKGPLTLRLCRDFYGREFDIKTTLEDILGNQSKIALKEIVFVVFPDDNLAHMMAGTCRKDRAGRLKGIYIDFPLESIEQFLRR